MGNMSYSQEELAELSEEELEGLKELEAAEAAENGNEDDDDLDAGAEPDTDGEGDADDADEEEAEEKADASDDETPNPAEATSKDDEDADKAPEPEEVSGNAPTPTFVAPDDLESRLTDIGKEKDAIAEKFDDGEITAADHREQLKKLDDEEWALRSQKVRADVSDDILRQQFVGEATNFVNNNERFKPGSRLWKMLDQEVRERQEADPENMYDPGIIAKAAASIEEELGLTNATPKDESEKDGKGKTGKKGLADIPPTLADVPASDPVEDDGSEFAHIDRLDGEAHERALAKLSPADRERYMQS